MIERMDRVVVSAATPISDVVNYFSPEAFNAKSPAVDTIGPREAAVVGRKPLAPTGAELKLQKSDGLSAVKWQKILTLADAPQGDTIKRANKPDGTKFQALARALENKSFCVSDLTLMTGIGLHEKSEFSLRVPVLLLPGLQIQKRVLRMGLRPPKYIVYQATDFIADCNGIDLAKARACAWRMQTYLQEYLNRYHAEVAPFVQIKVALPHNDSTRAAIQRVRNNVEVAGSNSVAITETVSSLRASGSRHAGRQDAGEEYLAANLFFSGVSRDEWPLLSLVAGTPSWIFIIGGQNERRFFRVLGALADTKTIPWITSSGAKSAYYPFTEEGDLSELWDGDTETKMSRDIAADYAILSASGAGRAELVDLIKTGKKNGCETKQTRKHEHAELTA